ncbi:11451_t:CDS:1 [Ambispora leptoticha]|uniref:11451_t:CDS:1 n=1 Tax=Ambispora leptoticha TaxID=144679 RepID=A0A9N8VD04_9GLOM|nr:11451_t:CDS:1 [Ambispora leptoticha]
MSSQFKMAIIQNGLRGTLCFLKPLRFRQVQSSLKSHQYSTMPVPKTHYEIERKFTFSQSNVSILETNTGPTKFMSMKHLLDQKFTDVYYDDKERNYPLTTNDIWLRQRDEIWECKCPMNPAASMDIYLELVKLPDIAEFIRQKLGRGESIPVLPDEAIQFKNHLLQQHNLSAFCTITTTRRKYLVDDQFTLVLDHADFGHSVGELEITVSKESEIPQAELKVAQFMNKHKWFFETKGVVFGKLSAYISKFNRHQWECMERSGILKQKLFPESLEDVVRRNEMGKAKTL